jgi:hypothetical protein
LIFLPRDLDKNSDLKEAIRMMTTSKQVMQGKPIEKPRKSTHRPMFVYFIHWNEDSKTCDGLFDLPTIISSIYQRAEDARKNKVERTSEFDLDIGQEILVFQNCLLQLIRENEETRDKVKIISIPKLPLDVQLLKKVSSNALHEYKDAN